MSDRSNIIESNLSQLTYRKDIDGLRACAVLSVIAFHAFPNALKGGFIGVDIFFVISGYLITGIIINNLEKNTFSFFDFYNRRIRRIFPALLVVLITCFIVGWGTLLNNEFKQLGKHIAGAGSFISNLLLWKESGYFDNAAESKVLLHLWSLGIEEQFYIFWPLLLWRVWKNKINLLFTIFIVAFISFVINISNYRSNPIADFYSPFTRIWELLAGSILAYKRQYKIAWFDSHMNNILKLINKKKIILESYLLRTFIKNTQSIIGVLFITYSLIILDKNYHFPGFWALLSVFGSVLIIDAGSFAFINNKLLSNRILIWIGLISYPLYLWYWPLLSFARIHVGETPSITIRLVLVAISFLLAILTYKLIEMPIRFGINIKKNISPYYYKFLYYQYWI